MRKPVSYASGLFSSLLPLFSFNHNRQPVLPHAQIKGGGQVEKTTLRKPNTDDVALHSGYKIDVVTTGLTFPTAVTTDDEGRLYVIEAGYSYSEVFGKH